MQFEQGQLHDALKPISWLAGRWVTEAGRGSFPNLTDFKYHEELEFICIVDIIKYDGDVGMPAWQNFTT